MSYTTILHSVRKNFGLSCNEYCVADMVRCLSGNPNSPVPGWCNASRSYLADQLDLSRQSVITIIKTLVDKTLIEENEAKHMRATALFYDAIMGCKETLQGVKNLDTFIKTSSSGVKKLDRGCKETLQAGCKETLQGGVKKLDTIIIDNNNTSDNDTDKQKKKVAAADATVFSEEVVIEPVSKKEPASKLKQSPKMANGEKAPQVAPTPPIVTQIRQLIESRVDGYYWQAKDGGAAKQLADKLRHAIQQKSGGTECTNDEVMNALTVLLNRTAELPTYYQFTDIPTLNGKFNEILTQLRIPRTSNQTAGPSRSVAPAHRSRAEQLDQVAELFGAIDAMVSAKQNGGFTG